VKTKGARGNKTKR